MIKQICIYIYQISFCSTVHRFTPGSIELTLKARCQKYENSNVKFFKCNIIDVKHALPTAFKVTQAPTFIFFRGGQERVHLKKPTEEVFFAKLDELILPQQQQQTQQKQQQQQQSEQQQQQQKC